MDSQYRIILFSQFNFKGRALVLFDKIDCLNEVCADWNDEARSVIVAEGAWNLKIDCIGYGGENEKGMNFYDNENGGLYAYLNEVMDRKVSAVVPVVRPMPPDVQVTE